MKTAIIGVGGQGAAITTAAYNRLLQSADQSINPSAKRQEIASDVRIFCVETAEKDYEAFPNDNKWLLTPLESDAHIRGRAGFLKEWWPAGTRRVGPFDTAGVGQFRQKARLGYYLHGANDVPAGDQIAEAIIALAGGNQNNNPGAAPVTTIYICGSLSGGTGSGILLTLAMHLRHLVGANTRIIGVIPLASVMELWAGGQARDRAWANCSTGLREIEWWMTPEEARSTSINPFFEVGINTRIPEDLTPFDLCYVFTHQNTNNLVLASREEYTQFVADCIALEMQVEGAQESLAADIMALSAIPALPMGADGLAAPNAKPIGFGSLGSAALVYPVHAITDYLGMRLLATTLNTTFLGTPEPDNEVENWINQSEIGLDSDVLAASLKEPCHDSESGETLRIGSRPGIPGLDQANASGAVQAVTQARRHFDDRWLVDLAHVADCNRMRRLIQLQTACGETVRQMLARDEHGFPKVRRFVAGVQTRMQSAYNALDRELNGVVVEGTVAEQGLTHRIDDLNRRYEAEHNEISGFGGLRGIGGGGQLAKRKMRFQRQWWTPYTQTSERRVLVQNVMELLSDFDIWIGQIHSVLDQMASNLENQSSKAELKAKAQLGRNRPGRLVNEYGALDDPELVMHAFGTVFRRVSEPGGVPTVNLVQGILGNKDAGLRAMLLDFMPDPREPADSDRWTDMSVSRNRGIANAVSALVEKHEPVAARHFRQDAEQLGLWGALTAEFERTYTGLPQNFENERLQYVTNLIRWCIDRSQPYWHLDGERIAAIAGNQGLHSSHSRSVSGSTSLVRLRQGSAEDQSLADNIQARMRAQGIGAQDNQAERGLDETGTDHALYILTRERGYPLRFLHGNEQKRMFAAEKMFGGPVYVDQRYYGVIPNDFELQPLVVDQRSLTSAARTLSSAMTVGVLRFAPNPNRFGIPGIELLDGQEWSMFTNTLPEALERIATDPQLSQHFGSLVSRRQHRFSAEERKESFEAQTKIVVDVLALDALVGSGEQIAKLVDSWTALEQAIADNQQDIEIA